MFSTLPMVVESEVVADGDVNILARRLFHQSSHYTGIYICYPSSFNPHWHVVAVCTFEFLVLRRLSQATLELRARVCLGYLP
jgi:hypothetical protein